MEAGKEACTLLHPRHLGQSRCNTCRTAQSWTSSTEVPRDLGTYSRPPLSELYKEGQGPLPCQILSSLNKGSVGTAPGQAAHSHLIFQGHVFLLLPLPSPARAPRTPFLPPLNSSPLETCWGGQTLGRAGGLGAGQGCFPPPLFCGGRLELWSVKR